MLSILIGKVPRPAGYPLGNIKIPIIYDIIATNHQTIADEYADTKTGYFSIGCDDNFLWMNLVLAMKALSDVYDNSKVIIRFSSSGDTPIDTKREM